MYYPILFRPIYKQMLWGGGKLKLLPGRGAGGPHHPPPGTGESWDVSCREGCMSIAENGPDAGQTLKRLSERDRIGYLGTSAAKGTFPLLVKIIDAGDDLSVQVHPGEENASGGENAKNETWYVIEPPDCGYLYAGLNEGVTVERFMQTLYSGHTVLDQLKKVYVRPGDILEIPDGLVHALTKGALIAEVQQNSDTTFRLYDYNRTEANGKPRELHIKKGVNVIKTEKPRDISQNPFYSVESVTVNGKMRLSSDGSVFSIVTCTDGEVFAQSGPDGGYAVTVFKGRSAFIPAALTDLALAGDGSVLVTKIKPQ
ncbi:MAG: class I mannose-6-phosphate isomerase [Defluviitaleaceae bacterium]|nr:class I mannose-6-phosphate isomerase [Defluviitaleaceae bacterium]